MSLRQEIKDERSSHRSIYSYGRFGRFQMCGLAAAVEPEAAASVANGEWRRGNRRWNFWRWRRQSAVAHEARGGQYVHDGARAGVQRARAHLFRREEVVDKGPKPRPMWRSRTPTVPRPLGEVRRPSGHAYVDLEATGGLPAERLRGPTTSWNHTTRAELVALDG